MLELPEHVKAAFLEAGGCRHTPQPWLACDTCGRPIPPWALATAQQVTAFDWQAKLIDGSVVEKRDLSSFSNVPEGRAVSVNVATTSPRAPVIRAIIDPRRGEQVHLYATHAVKMGMRPALPGGDPDAGFSPVKVSVTVLEVTPDPNKPDQKVRLYVHPQCLILSTEELRF